MADSQVWRYDSKGVYSVNSGYHIARFVFNNSMVQKQSSSFQPPSKYWKLIWAFKGPLKICHFWWRVCNNALASRENLFKRRCTYSDLCPICHSRPESFEHLLFGCDWVRPIWFGSNLNYRVKWDSIHSILEWSSALMEQFQTPTNCASFFSQVASTSWFIWKGRNEFIFNHQPIDPVSVLHCARKAGAEYESAFDMGVSLHPQVLAAANFFGAHWVPPPSGQFKINCDVAVQTGSSQAAAAAILQNSIGQMRDRLTQKWCISSSLQGEALSYRLACQLAQAYHPAIVKVEGDNKQVIHLCVSEDVPHWECGAIVHDIKQLADQGTLSFHWCSRTANGVAH
ncbi:putative ribonuclease H protein [Camellia lanceoleosa]|uniref:Ribonuclease H protein n=1 Tax=Camellia lanceoleosa TaxID=1840588 RepID=A0ACC0HQF3_9ERIC|nr:putative ribonuclease H protein [Camellia lanceoleosa]